MLVVMHLYDWSYEQAEHWVSDSLVLRQFCRVYAQKPPDDTTLIGWANLSQPDTLQQLLDHVAELARQHHVTRGRKLRLDSTVAVLSRKRACLRAIPTMRPSSSQAWIFIVSGLGSRRTW
jgi:hypothetical protein